MELDDLKKKWRELDERLISTDERIDRLTAEVTTGRFTSARQRLMRTLQLGVCMLLCMPLIFANVLRYETIRPEMAIVVLLIFFIVVMLVRQVVLIALLRRIDPARQSVFEACTAVLRFRTCFMAGAVVGIVVAVPFVVMVGIYLSRFDTPYVLYGFVAGLVVGVPLGVRIFLRMLRDINALRAALTDADGAE